MPRKMPNAFKPYGNRFINRQLDGTEELSKEETHKEDMFSLTALLKAYHLKTEFSTV